jgi:hypothetical protein
MRPGAARCFASWVTSLSAVVGLSACQLTRDRVCTAELVHGLAVTVVDSLTGEPPASALLIAREGSFIDSVGPRSPYQPGIDEPPVLVLTAAAERPGTYDLSVRAQGYRDWTRASVSVTADECHVFVTEVTARLQR